MDSWPSPDQRSGAGASRAAAKVVSRKWKRSSAFVTWSKPSASPSNGCGPFAGFRAAVLAAKPSSAKASRSPRANSADDAKELPDEPVTTTVASVVRHATKTR